MIIKKLVPALVLIAMVHCEAVAQQAHKKNPCDNAQTQAEMDECSAREYRAADQKLNKLYADLSSKLEPERLAKLKETQRAWIKFRDADCEFQAYLNKGGTIYPVVYNGCLTDNANNRIKQLEQMLNEENSR
jgi:uncharacterized protein YecT (DUF1311 family)